MDSNFEPLGQDDVLHIPVGTPQSRSPRLMDTVSVFTASFNESFNGWPYASFVTSSEGYPISILKTSGGGWQKGKLRIRVVVEFEPDPIVSDPEQQL
jgi:KGK domain